MRGFFFVIGLFFRATCESLGVRFLVLKDVLIDPNMKRFGCS